MSTLEMVDKAIDVIGKKNIYCIMHCTSTYPTKPEESNVLCIPRLKERYPWTKIGFSNHYPGLMSMVMAATLGVDMIECHVTLDRTLWGSDQASSIEPQGIFDLMKRIELIEKNERRRYQTYLQLRIAHYEEAKAFTLNFRLKYNE